MPTRLPRSLLLLACVLAAFAHAEAIELLDVPLEHWAYEMLERLEIRAVLERSGLETRPLTRGALARLVRRLHTEAQRGAWQPTRIERQQLEMLGAEFSEELRAQGEGVPLEARAYHRWSGDGWGFQMFYVGRERFDHRNPDPSQASSQTDARLIFEPAAALQLGTHFVAFQQLSYRVRTSDGVFQNSVDPRDGEAEFVFDSRDRFSITRTTNPYLRWGRGTFLVDLGRERLRWGPGRHNAMLLLDNSPGFDQLRVHLSTGRLAFTSVTGQLRAGRLLPTEPQLDEKYLAAHRLVVQAHKRLVVAVSEAVIYGNRGVDLAYLNPLTVLFVTQANNGDIDNALVSVDAKVLLPNLELYAEVAVDDLNLRRGLRHFGNKVGLLAGFLWLAPLGADDWDLEFEWSWASQYMYTHPIAVNRYQQFGGVLGSRAGPDAELWVVGLRRRFSRGWRARLFYELERHGEGGLGIDHEQRSSDAQEYLSGIVENRHQPGVELCYRGLRNLELRLDYRFLQVTKPGHDESRGNLDGHAVGLETRLEF